MRHELSDIGHGDEAKRTNAVGKHSQTDNFVLEKSIFNNIFEKDIRRAFIYKKAERLAKALHLVAPAFAGALSLKSRLDSAAVGLIDAAMLPPTVSRIALSRELLALSSVLSIARTGSILSPMNAEIIVREAHALLQEVASYEEPRLSLDDSTTLSSLAKDAVSRNESLKRQAVEKKPNQAIQEHKRAAGKGQSRVKDKSISDKPIKDRHNAILSVIKNKGNASIKDISMLIRGVSEKTIQRELSVLIGAGEVLKKGERRWSTYSIA